MRWSSSSFLLAIVVVAAKMADKEVQIPVVKSELECEQHCTSLTACRAWAFEENACAVTMLPHAFLAGAPENGISLLQGGSCNIWEDSECGMQVETFEFGDCTYGFANPEHCMGYCSKGCEFIRDPCEASCQPVITFGLTIDTGNKKKKLLQCLPPFFEANLRAELTALWGAPDESFVDLTTSCEDVDTVTVLVTITPFSIGFPTTEFIVTLSLAATIQLSAISHPILAQLVLFNCIEGCVVFSYPFTGTSTWNSNGQLSWYLEGNLDILFGEVVSTSYVNFLHTSDRSLAERVSLVGYWVESGIVLSVAPGDTSGFSFTYEGPYVDDWDTESVILWTTIEQGNPIQRQNAWDWVIDLSDE